MEYLANHRHVIHLNLSAIMLEECHQLGLEEFRRGWVVLLVH